MCRVFFCIVGRGCVLWSVHSLGKTLLAFALIHSVFQSQISRYCRYWLCTLAFHSLMMKRTSLFFVLVLEGLVSLHRTVQLQLLQHYWLGHWLGLLDIVWFALEMNRVHSVIFEIASKYCILDCLDHGGYSNSSEGFLPVVVDIMVIWVKYTHSSPF